MKSIVFRLLTSCVAIFAITVFAGFAIGQNPLPFNYQVKYSPVINGLSIKDVVRINGGINAGLYVVGHYRGLDSVLERGFIYRYVDGQPDGQLFDMPTVLRLSETEWPRTACYGMNDSGVVVGVRRDSADRRHAVYFNLFESATPTLHILNNKLGVPAPSANGPGAYKINARGDILMDRNVEGFGIVVNPFSNESYVVPGLVPGDFGSGMDINDLGTVLANSSQGGALRSNIHDLDSAEYFPDAYLLGDPGINNFDEFCARVDVPDGKRKNRVKQYAMRYGSSPVDDWSSDPFEIQSTNGINDSGDICGEVAGFGNPDGYLHYSIGTVNSNGTVIENGPTVGLQSLITDEYFASGFLWEFKISNRIELSDAISAPIVCGNISPDGNTNRQIFFLIPELPEVEPGISVNPTFGLVTTEGGGTASFDVVLQTEPAANVTIDISSSDLTEGTVDKAILTFTPDNWNTPQTVTVTGVDDTIKDGDVAYVINTAPAVSTDLDYNGLDVDDVLVTNLDNDGRKGGKR